MLVALLACVAGGVDAFSYLHLERVFPANMTGNTVQLGLAIAQLDWAALSRSGVALLGYVAGVAVGAMLVRTVEREAWDPSITRALVLEVLILSAVAALYFVGGQSLAQPVLLVLIGLASTAMGVQSVAIQGLRITGVVTTYITGTITAAVQRIVQHARSVATPAAPPTSSGWGLLVMVWGLYLGSAIGTVAATYITPHLALGVPIALLAAVVLIAIIRPP